MVEVDLLMFIFNLDVKTYLQKTVWAMMKKMKMHTIPGSFKL